MIELSEEVVERLATAIDSGKVLTAAYVDEAGKPHISFYGSTHVTAPDQLALWVRNAESALLKTLVERPHIAFIYGDVSNRVYYTFEGQARVSPAARESVYQGMHPIERQFDPEQNGVAVLVDLDRFTSLSAAGKIVQER
jgi:hypothetical protein